jgi:2-polyprenyl-6-methoxyphenol hydroxylase-like FAD-dependent oxidoreductase
LRQVLLKAIDRQRYHFGHVFARVEQDVSGIHVYFANGRTERADLLVGCDGLRSSVRAYLAPEVQPIYAGYYIWRGAPNESELAPETRRTMFPYYFFSWPIGCRPSATRFRAWTTNCAQATGATISAGIV